MQSQCSVWEDLFNTETQGLLGAQAGRGQKRESGPKRQTDPKGKGQVERGRGGRAKSRKEKLRNMKPWTLEMLIERHFMKTKKEENKQCVKPLQKKKVRQAFPLVQCYN